MTVAPPLSAWPPASPSHRRRDPLRRASERRFGRPAECPMIMNPMESALIQSLVTSTRCSRRRVLPPGMRRGLLLLALPALLLAFFALTAPPALAAPTWGIAMEHHNAYGAQGGVDPYTGSGTTFDRESGFNAYTITVKNTGTAFAGGQGVGDTLSCEAGGNTAGASLTYQWLRHGAVISGATGSTYQLQTADEGTALQCEVTASDGEGTDVAISPSSLVAPIPSTLPPAEGRAETEG